MDKFLETYNLPKLNQEESENLHRQIAPSEFEAVIKKPSTNQNPEPEHLTGEFYHTFWEKLISLFLKLFHKIQKEISLSHSFYKATIILLTNHVKGLRKL